jgi:ribosomal protein L7/L12
MKLLVSYSEAQSMVRRQMGLNSDVEVVIGRRQDDKHVVVADLSPEYKRLVEFVDANQAFNKIGAIKEYRAVTGFGLKEAKDSVENWSIVRPFIMRHGRAPQVSYANGMTFES